MKNIFFDYKIDLSVIDEENKNDLQSMEKDSLKSFFNGKIYIFFQYKDIRNFIILETGIFDYLLQFDDLLLSIDGGITKTYTISCDYYSNNLIYQYSNLNNKLEINEGNSDLFKIECDYFEFKNAYKNFRKKILKELIIFYPKLKYNQVFIEYNYQ